MAETDVHRKQMIALLEGLESYYRDDPNIYVTGNIFFYLPRVEGERTALSPDVFVVKGVAKKIGAFTISKWKRRRRIL